MVYPNYIYWFIEKKENNIIVFKLYLYQIIIKSCRFCKKEMETELYSSEIILTSQNNFIGWRWTN